MINFFATPSSFFILLSLYALGSLGALFFRNNDSLANYWSGFFAIVGSLYGLIFSISTVIVGTGFFYKLGSPYFPLLSISLHVDLLSSFFIFVISLIALFCSIYGIGYVKHFYTKYSLGTLGFFYNLFIVGMLLVVSASNGFFFLVAWEIMSVASYFLVVYDRNDESNVKAGFLYLVMTHVGTAFIMFAFLLFYKFTGSFEFDAIASAVALIPPSVKNAIFLLALVGFGTKAGIIPFHIWLPAAHPAAPSHVSGLMSGVMIKTGIYMMIRIFLDILQPVPVWWGLTILIVGSVSSLLGVLYAITKQDIKKLLAYSSIENIGIILLGLGGALAFKSLDLPSLALLSLVAALFHILNHAIFKSLLFLGAGSIINETRTRNMEEYGGLIKYMPQTAMFFLIGSMAISALPPFNGFFSEWLTYQSLFRGIAQLHLSSQWIFILAAGSLAFTGGLALACFVNAFGTTFLARPRSSAVTHAKESSLFMRLGMGALAALSILLGLFSGYVTILLGKISSAFVPFDQNIIVDIGFPTASAPVLFALPIAISFIVFVIGRYLINKKQKVTIGTTWNCGVDLTRRMEITVAGFSRSLVLIFKSILKPSIQHEIEYHDAESRFLPKSRVVTLGVGDMYKSYFYKPLLSMINGLSLRIKNIQSGNINVYISYIFIALVIALILVL